MTNHWIDLKNSDCILIMESSPSVTSPHTKKAVGSRISTTMSTEVTAADRFARPPSRLNSLALMGEKMMASVAERMMVCRKGSTRMKPKHNAITRKKSIKYAKILFECGNGVSGVSSGLSFMVETGAFREDLFYRIRSAVLQLPPLRELKDDVLPIAQHHLERICRDSRLGQKTLSGELRAFLKGYAWPGNVRELIHVLEAMVASAPDEEMLLPAHLPQELRIQMLRARVGRADSASSARPAAGGNAPEGPLTSWNTYKKQEQERVECAYLDGLIQASGGDLKQAMQISGLSPSRLYGLLSKYGRSLGGTRGQRHSRAEAPGEAGAPETDGQ